MSHLDYASAMLLGMPKTLINIMQCTQNWAARITIGKTKIGNDSATEIRSLHWLPIKERIDFKITTHIYKCQNNQAPMYLQKLITEKKIKHPGLHSSKTKFLLEVPSTKRHIIKWAEARLEDDDDDDVDEDDDEDSDAVNIGTSSQLLHIISHQKAFMPWSKFPTEVLQQLDALKQAMIHQQGKTCKKQASLMSFSNKMAALQSPPQLALWCTYTLTLFKAVHILPKEIFFKKLW